METPIFPIYIYREIYIYIGIILCSLSFYPSLLPSDVSSVSVRATLYRTKHTRFVSETPPERIQREIACASETHVHRGRDRDRQRAIEREREREREKDGEGTAWL